MLPTTSSARNIASGFGFWNQTAGFDISQTLIEYSAQGGTYGRAFWVGLLNTLLVAAIGIVLATIVGFLVGIARLSKNFLLARAFGWLRRADPQRAAAAAIAVLVQRRAQGAARPARQLDAAGQHLSQQSRLLRARIRSSSPASSLWLAPSWSALSARSHTRAGRKRSRSAPASSRRSRWSRSA